MMTELSNELLKHMLIFDGYVKQKDMKAVLCGSNMDINHPRLKRQMNSSIMLFL